MKKYLSLVRLYIKLNLQRNLAYRYNTLFLFLSSGTYIITYVLGSRYLFNNTDSVMGFSYQELYLLILLAQTWMLINILLTRKNFQFISNEINKGHLDFLLLKPIKIRPLIPSLQFDFRTIPTIATLLVMIFIELSNLDLSLIQILGAGFFFLNGLMMIYSITSIFVCSTFWVGRNNIIFELTMDMPDLARIPITFFPVALKWIFIFAWPVILMVNPSFQILYNRIEWPILGYAILMNIILFIISECTWKKGIKNYSSAN